MRRRLPGRTLAAGERWYGDRPFAHTAAERWLDIFQPEVQFDAVDGEIAARSRAIPFPVLAETDPIGKCSTSMRPMWTSILPSGSVGSATGSKPPSRLRDRTGGATLTAPRPGGIRERSVE